MPSAHKNRMVFEFDDEIVEGIDAARRAEPGPGVRSRAAIVRDALRRALVVRSKADVEAERERDQAQRLTAAELEREQGKAA